MQKKSPQIQALCRKDACVIANKLIKSTIPSYQTQDVFSYSSIPKTHLVYYLPYHKDNGNCHLYSSRGNTYIMLQHLMG